ncbi:uncharacterized protein FMAN_07012 [Fusarium mangiferae]|uniref:Uncharacterized protein n=1 Tax=Fusarium mangiferae TaxID=192010 RepID=A0A1L7TB07_FUSMA|nr:uncharacterized protein FMAN_07012 [Fusarium mangiferae]CVK91976.1 uncharacterized protein FMAN_07012 [Fusarium mangiferae]
MTIVPIFTLILSIFATDVSCVTRFLRPPQWITGLDSEADLGKNIRYSVGDTIELLWGTNLDKVELFLVQETRSRTVRRDLDASRTEWKAEWDVSGLAEGNEDSLYWFALRDPDDPELDIASTQYFNVTAPELETSIILHTSTTTHSATSKAVVVSNTQIIARPTITAPSTSEEASSDAGSDSGMTKGETAGAAVGGTIGGLILLGAIGWLIWRRLGRSKRNTDASMVSQSHQGQVNYSETKAELPGDPVVELYPAGYARSPPGLHEAP